MTKRRLFDDIKEGLEEVQAIIAGTADPATYRVHVFPVIDVKAIRKRHGLSQRDFAARYGFGYDAVRDWERGRRMPEAAARSYLLVIDREPEAVARALAAA